MDPKETHRTGTPGPAMERKMDPRLWALLPLVALAILGAYFVGKRNTAPPAPAVAAPPAPTVAPPPPPRGKITVTEVPKMTVEPVAPPVAVPPKVTPPAPPARTAPYEHEEPPVVLRPEPDEPPIVNPDDGSTAPSDTATPDEGGKPQGDGDRDPVKLNDPAQEYPASAYNEGVQGSVKVSFTISEAGAVSSAQVSQSSGDDRLDGAALDYVKRLKFRPALRQGRPAEVRASRTVVFQIPR